MAGFLPFRWQLTATTYPAAGPINTKVKSRETGKAGEPRLSGGNASTAGWMERVSLQARRIDGIFGVAQSARRRTMSTRSRMPLLRVIFELKRTETGLRQPQPGQARTSQDKPGQSSAHIELRRCTLLHKQTKCAQIVLGWSGVRWSTPKMQLASPVSRDQLQAGATQRPASGGRAPSSLQHGVGWPRWLPLSAARAGGR